jgi:hypothetical protein
MGIATHGGVVGAASLCVLVSLFWRVVLINATGLVVAALVLALSAATVSPTLTATEGAVLAAAPWC